MKKILLCILLIFSSLNFLFSTNISIKKPVTFYYSNDKIQDLIDYAIIDVTDEIKNSDDPFIKQKLIDNIVKKVCDYLTSKGFIIPTTPPLYIPSPDNASMLFGVPIMDFQKSHLFYSYPSWYTKPTDYEGTRMIEVIDNQFEQNAISINEASVVGLPLKLLFLISPFSIGNIHKYYLHVAMVEPVNYLKNFFNPPEELLQLFESEKDKILNNIYEALSNESRISFENIYPKYSKSVNIPSIIKIAEISNVQIETFVNNFLKTPDILTKLPKDSLNINDLNNSISTFSLQPSTFDFVWVRYVSHNPNDPNFPYNYNPSFLNPEQTIVTGILSFCRFILPTKNIWLMLMPDGHSINYLSMMMLMPQMTPSDFNPPKSAPMEFLIKNSLVHIYARYFPDNQTDEKYIKFEYTTNDGRKIYQLSVFDPYITTALLTSGQWHKPFSYVNIYLYEFDNGSIGIYAKNPVYLIEKYYSDVSDEAILNNANSWDNTPTTMFHFPKMSKQEMGEFMLNKIKTLINKTLDFMGLRPQ